MSSKAQAIISATLFAGLYSGALAADGATGTLSGANGNDMRVLIRSIDDGDILWAGGYKLDTQASIAPGAHTVSVMCEFHQSWGAELDPGKVSLTAEAGKTYALTGVKSADGQSCDVTATAK